MIAFQKLKSSDFAIDTFLAFSHNQTWTHSWKKVGQHWILTACPGSRAWDEEKRIWLSRYLQELIDSGGSVIAAFDGTVLVGFAAVEGSIIDNGSRYGNLAMLFVDDTCQRQGIGRRLMEETRREALRMGAEKLFISAIPSEETIAFYLAIGCRDAQTVIPAFIDTDEDRYLELAL